MCMKERPLMWRVAANTFNKKSRTADKVWSCSTGLGQVLTIPHHKKYHVTNRSHRPRTKTDSLVRVQQSKTDMRFGTRNVTSHYRSGSLTAAAREFARYKLDLLGVQEIKWDKVGAEIAENYKFFCVKKGKIINWKQDFLYTTE